MKFKKKKEKNDLDEIKEFQFRMFVKLRGEEKWFKYLYINRIGIVKLIFKIQKFSDILRKALSCCLCSY